MSFKNENPKVAVSIYQAKHREPLSQRKQHIPYLDFHSINVSANPQNSSKASSTTKRGLLVQSHHDQKSSSKLLKNITVVTEVMSFKNENPKVAVSIYQAKHREPLSQRKQHIPYLDFHSINVSANPQNSSKASSTTKRGLLVQSHHDQKSSSKLLKNITVVKKTATPHYAIKLTQCLESFKAAALANSDTKETPETARFHQEDNEIKRMKETLATTMSKKRDALNELISSRSQPQSQCDSNEPQFSQRVLQRLIAQKSKSSISPQHSHPQLEPSELFSNTTDLSERQLTSILKQEPFIKSNPQSKLVNSTVLNMKLVNNSNEPQFSSRVLQRLIAQKSKSSISPQHSHPQLEPSELFSNTTDLSERQLASILNQLQEPFIKSNPQSKLVKVAQINLEVEIEANKAMEKQIKGYISQLQGLKIRNQNKVEISVPFMKALFGTNILYLNLANNGIKQNALQLSLIMLEYVDLSGNHLENLTIIKNCINLQEVQASIECLSIEIGQNQIVSVCGLQEIKHLSLVDLSNNQIKSFETILQLKKNQHIKAINMLNNPVSKYPNYKRFIKQILPGCDRIDSDIVEVLVSQNNQDSYSSLFILEGRAKSISKRYYNYDEYQQLSDTRRKQLM